MKTKQESKPPHNPNKKLEKRELKEEVLSKPNVHSIHEEPSIPSSSIILEAIGKSTGNLVSLLGKIEANGGKLVKLDVETFFDEKRKRKKIKMRAEIEKRNFEEK